MNTYTLTEARLKELLMAMAGCLVSDFDHAEKAADKVLSDLRDPDSIVHRTVLSAGGGNGE